METLKTTTFFDLPPELRNTIYEQVFFHWQTDGIISPIPTKDPNRYVALLDGQRFLLQNRHPVWATQRPSRDPAEHAADVAKVKEQNHALRNSFERTSNARNRHFCTFNCLRQPRVARVSRQMREEVLSVFYGSHRFHLEMSNFEVTNSNGLVKQSGWSPMKWWRMIGDTNLRRIGHLSIVCQPSAHEAGRLTIMLEYFSSTGKLETQRLPRLPTESAGSNVPRPRVPHPIDATKFERYRYKKATRNGEFEHVLAPHLNTLKGSGLHVVVLESIVAALEPCDSEYLRDYLSLGEDLEIGVIEEGRGERALHWKPF